MYSLLMVENGLLANGNCTDHFSGLKSTVTFIATFLLRYS